MLALLLDLCARQRYRRRAKRFPLRFPFEGKHHHDNAIIVARRHTLAPPRAQKFSIFHEVFDWNNEQDSRSPGWPIIVQRVKEQY